MRFNHREHRDSFNVPSVHGNKAGLCIVNEENFPDQKRSSTSNSRWRDGVRERTTNEISSRFTSRFRAFAVPFSAVTDKARLCALCGSNLVFSLFLALLLPVYAHAHPMVENALDVVIGRDKILIDARISMEQILIASAKGGPVPARDQWPQLAREHADYVLRHLQIHVDGQLVPGKAVAGANVPTTFSSNPALIPYRFEYLLDNPPRIALWTALCAFSLGVELGHQVVVLPMFLGMKWLRQTTPDPNRLLLSTRIVKFGSGAITIAGVYFLIQAFR